MKQASVEDYNLFMMCPTLNRQALRPLPEGYTLRFCQKQELEFWMKFHFDTAEEKNSYLDYMKSFFQQVYAPFGDLFFRSCRFLCDPQGRPVGSSFLWKAYGTLPTLHWLKVQKGQEGKGLGRALLSQLLEPWEEYPVYLHTQPGSFRAIKLYTDFGFQLLSGPDKIGSRENQLSLSLPYLKERMFPGAFKALAFAPAPQALLEAASRSEISEF